MGIREVVVVKRRARGRGEGWILGKSMGEGREWDNGSSRYCALHESVWALSWNGEFIGIPWEPIL